MSAERSFEQQESGRRTALTAAAGPGARPAAIAARSGEPAPQRRRTRPAPLRFLSAAAVPDLPDADAQALLPEAPLDQHRDRPASGLLVHPRAPLPVFGSDGRPFALIRPVHHGAETWLPVIARQPGWLRVLLSARPNGASGWIDAVRVTRAITRLEVRIALDQKQLHLTRDDHSLGSWPISISPGVPIPTGRTFLLSAVRRTPHTAPVLLRLATHAEPHRSALVTIHHRPDPAEHHQGRIHVPEAAMTALGAAPPGCLVRISSR